MSTIVLSDSSDDEIVFFPVESSKIDNGDDEVIFCGVNNATIDNSKSQVAPKTIHRFPPSVESSKTDNGDDEVIFCGLKSATTNDSKSQVVEQKTRRFPPSVSKDVTIVSNVVRREVEKPDKDGSDDEIVFLGIRKVQAGPNPASFNININSQESLKNTNVTIDIEEDAACIKKKVQLTFLGAGSRNRSNSTSSSTNTSLFNPQSSSTPRQKTSSSSTPRQKTSSSSTPRQKTSSSNDVARNSNRNPAFICPKSNTPKRSAPLDIVSQNNNRNHSSNPVLSRTPGPNKVKPSNDISRNNNVNPLSSSTIKENTSSLSNFTNVNQVAGFPPTNNRNDNIKNLNYTKIHWDSIPKAVPSIKSRTNKQLPLSSNDVCTKINQNTQSSNSSVKPKDMVRNYKTDLSKENIKLAKKSNEIIQDLENVKNLGGPQNESSSVKAIVKNHEKNSSKEQQNISVEKGQKLTSKSEDITHSQINDDKRLFYQNEKEPMPSTSGSKRNTSPLPNRTSEPMPSTSGTSKISLSLLPDQTLKPDTSTSGKSKGNLSPLLDQSFKPMPSTSGKSQRNPSPVPSQVSTNSSSDTEEESSSSQEDSDSSSQSNQCEVPRPSMSKPALDTLFNKFLANCTKVNNGLSVMKMKAKLKKVYICSNNITRNDEFIMSLKEASIKVESKSTKNPLEMMKKVLVQLRRDSPTTRLNIKKLEKALEEINKKIKLLEDAEVTSDEDEHDNSYVKLDKYRKRAVEIYNKLCEMNSVPADAERPTLRNVSFHGKVPGDLSKSITASNLVNRVSRALERYHNKSRKFPDFHDVLLLMQKLSKESGSQLKNETLHQLARSLFEEFGDILQKRRLYDEYQICSEYLGDDDDDPYYSDPILAAKLDMNKRFRTKEKDVLQKFSMKQATLKENGLSDSATHSSSEEVSDEDKKSTKKKIKKSSDEWTSCENSLDEKVTSKVKSKRKVLCKRVSRSRSGDRDKKHHRDKSTEDKECDQKSFKGNDNLKKMKRNRNDSSGSDGDLEEKVKQAKLHKGLVQDNEQSSVNRSSDFLQSENEKAAVEETDKFEVVLDENSREFHFGDDDDDVVVIEEKNDADAEVDPKECEISDHGNENLLNSSGLLITSVMTCQENFTTQDQIKEALIVPTIDLLSDDDEEPNVSGRNVLTQEEILEIIPCVLNQSK